MGSQETRAVTPRWSSSTSKNKSEFVRALRAYQEAFPRFIFYFDGIDQDAIRPIIQQIRQLGATVEPFFSTKVTHVIVPDSLGPSINETQATTVVGGKSNPAGVRPVVSGNGPSADSGGDGKRETPKDDIVQLARKWEKKMWTLSKLVQRFLRYMPGFVGESSRVDLASRRLVDALQEERIFGVSRTLQSPALSSSRSRLSLSNRAADLKSRYDIHYLRQIYVLVEDITNVHRPIIMGEYPLSKNNSSTTWPRLYIVPPGRCPFVRYDDPNTGNPTVPTTTTAVQTPTPGVRVRPFAKPSSLSATLSRNSRDTTTNAAATTKLAQAGESPSPAQPSPMPQPTLSVASGLHQDNPSTTQYDSLRSMSMSVDSGALAQRANSSRLFPLHSQNSQLSHQGSTTDKASGSSNLWGALGIPVPNPLNGSHLTSRLTSYQHLGQLSKRAVPTSLLTPTSRPPTTDSQEPAVSTEMSKGRGNEGRNLLLAVSQVSSASGHITDASSAPTTYATTTTVLEGVVTPLPQRITKRHVTPDPGRSMPRLKPVAVVKSKPSATTKRPGYCENCRVKYDDLQEHVHSSVHQQFAQNTNNYIELDQLLGSITRPIKLVEEPRLDTSLVRSAGAPKKSDSEEWVAQRLVVKFTLPPPGTPEVKLTLESSPVHRSHDTPYHRGTKRKLSSETFETIQEDVLPTVTKDNLAHVGFSGDLRGSLGLSHLCQWSGAQQVTHSNVTTPSIDISPAGLPQSSTTTIATIPCTAGDSWSSQVPPLSLAFSYSGAGPNLSSAPSPSSFPLCSFSHHNITPMATDAAMFSQNDPKDLVGSGVSASLQTYPLLPTATQSLASSQYTSHGSHPDVSPSETTGLASHMDGDTTATGVNPPTTQRSPQTTDISVDESRRAVDLNKDTIQMGDRPYITPAATGSLSMANGNTALALWQSVANFPPDQRNWLYNNLLAMSNSAGAASNPPTCESFAIPQEPTPLPAVATSHVPNGLPEQTGAFSSASQMPTLGDSVFISSGVTSQPQPPLTYSTTSHPLSGLSATSIPAFTQMSGSTIPSTNPLAWCTTPQKPTPATPMGYGPATYFHQAEGASIPLGSHLSPLVKREFLPSATPTQMPKVVHPSDYAMQSPSAAVNFTTPQKLLFPVDDPQMSVANSPWWLGKPTGAVSHQLSQPQPPVQQHQPSPIVNPHANRWTPTMYTAQGSPLRVAHPNVGDNLDTVTTFQTRLQMLMNHPTSQGSPGGSPYLTQRDLPPPPSSSSASFNPSAAGVRSLPVTPFRNGGMAPTPFILTGAGIAAGGQYMAGGMPVGDPLPDNPNPVDSMGQPDMDFGQGIFGGRFVKY
ncbi:Cdc7p-Dbf4p kinase complex regulatory subunit [Dispira parvispora]|uniref:Cdc7p-Dbf4p kinase complex regulatory subunit n=1 Tax=Dispira parvispora TaxID=1520584 RepID=A0A9W8AVR4_9FUNG|nr:Cdc7p-Dbf4p kinase complex regulatory subunit [Dispira parvispora]